MLVTTERAVARQNHSAIMNDPVLLSKITVPNPPKCMVPRERITKLAANGARGPLTVVTGPPGAGKTVALASWAAAGPGPRPAAWVTLDGFDNRPQTFWTYLLQALGHAGVIIPPELPASAAGQPDAFARQVALVLAGQDPAVSLILDDIDVLTDPACLGGLAYVLQTASSGLHLLVASRTDPLLPLHRYRLTGELTEIRAEDLAFSVSEAGLLMEQHGISLPTESLRTLTTRYEGWAAGLRLAAISMTGRPDPGQFIRELDAEDSAIAGYLVDEVLNAQSTEARDLLLKTSILDRVNAELAQDIAGNTRAGEVMSELARANAFVEPIGRGWYRYHSLFADVLRLKLRHESPGKAAQLHRRAAHWLWRNGTLTEAVSQATAGGDWQLAARMVVEELAIGPLLDPRTCVPLAAALHEITDVAGLEGPAPLIVAAAMVTRGEANGSAVALLHSAERLLEHLPGGEDVPSRFAAALIRLELARRSGDLEVAAAAAARAQVLARQLPPDLLTRHPEVRAQILAARAAADIWAGRPDDAASTLKEAAAAAHDPSQWAECLGHHALLEAIRGRLGAAGKLAATVTTAQGHQRSGVAQRPSAAAEVALAWVSVERNHLSDAAGRLSQAQDALHVRPDRLVATLAGLVAARLSLARGRAGAAAEMAGQACRGWAVPAWLGQRLALAESTAYAAAGDLQAAVSAAERAGPPSSAARAVALARSRLAAKDTRAAALALASASSPPASETPSHIRLEARLAEAELCYATGHPDRGRHSLAWAFKLAEPERMLLPIALQHAWIEPVMRRDPALAGIFQRTLQPARALSGRPRSPSRDAGQPSPVIVEQLTGRELEVLRHISQMMSTAEIAEQMYLSTNTIKSHLKSIFRKLGVSHRAEAVRRAQGLALI